MLVTCPKFALPKAVFGGANCVRLKRVKNSARYSTPSFLSGPKFVLLNAEKSKFLTPSPRKVGSVRPSFPNVKSAGAVKQAVLNHSVSCAAPPSGDALLHPAT